MQATRDPFAPDERLEEDWFSKPAGRGPSREAHTWRPPREPSSAPPEAPAQAPTLGDDDADRWFV